MEALKKHNILIVVEAVEKDGTFITKEFKTKTLSIMEVCNIKIKDGSTLTLNIKPNGDFTINNIKFGFVLEPETSIQKVVEFEESEE